MGPICQKGYSAGDLRFVQDALYVLGGKWKLEVIRSIAQGNSRFGEIRKSLPKITTRTLSRELKELEANHIIERTIQDDFPPVVNYTFTSYSKALAPVIDYLINWAAAHREEVIRASSLSTSS
ncbi:helix-turn-helix domain-containing protein [Chitinophaga sp. CC14]|uniref:winged helix-turn-helix transcriptional regulator n=1 Tax=Chitinophaga sp. CC14 TaxID=3029199 RepID=UPI003B80A0BA